MYTKDGGFVTLNAVGVVEGKFRCAPGDYDSIAIELLALYMNHPSMTTFGTCKFKGMVLSQGSLKKLGEFLRSAEEDIGAILNGTKTLPPGSTANINDLDVPEKGGS